MPHKVEISDKTYDKLREYCELNDLKMGQLADKYIYDSLMIEMYGDVPFTDYKRPQKEMVDIPVEIQKTIDDNFHEMLEEYHDPVSMKVNVLTGEVNITHDKDQKTDKSRYDAHPTKEFVEFWDGVEKWTAEQGKAKETMKQAGVPDKVVNRITKRRLK